MYKKIAYNICLGGIFYEKSFFWVSVSTVCHRDRRASKISFNCPSEGLLAIIFPSGAMRIR